MLFRSVKNAGSVATDEVIQAYIKDDSGMAVRNFSLCGFKRVELRPGEEKEVSITIPPKSFTAVDENGERVYDGNEFRIYIGTSAPDERSAQLTGKRPAELTVILNK